MEKYDRHRKMNMIMKKIWKAIFVAGLLCPNSAQVIAQTAATVRFDAQSTHQHITGFGGFVCSPQFGYNHMSETEIKKVWGPTSTLGCNIMRLYLPVGEGSWGQSLATAKLAKKLGLILFASPWGQPAEWKTNNSINAQNDNGVVGSLKRENWPDYAAYLEKYVQYLRKNGVELDAISIQNEPDWTPNYAGCKWTTTEMAEFVQTYGRQISCKIITPESIGCSDGYVNELNKTNVLPCFDIYGGHQYAGIGSAYKNLAQKGKEIWMTEYLINWNENQTTSRNFDFTKDFFNFFTAINTCMLGDFNAWVHYAAKRYYGMLGDGQNGTSNGTVTKRGYIMAHFAKFVTGMTRIDATFGGGLEGSAYLSETGDTLVAVMANASDNSIALTVDLPFYTQQGEQRTTAKSQSFKMTSLAPEAETCRPVVNIAAQSVVTVLFVKSRDRQPSNMTGSVNYFDRKRIDDLTTTKTNFGTTYKLSGKTKTFNHNTPLISSRTNANYGYVKLDEGMSRLVFEVKTLTSNLNYSSAQTTLTYVNSQGEVATHNYGDIEFPVHENFQWTFDLSTATLTDGCIGLISLTNNNWSSNLQFTFGDVYLTDGANSLYAGILGGDYVADDSYVLDFSTDPSCTSIDMTAVTGLPATLPWLEGSNRVVYVADNSELSGTNVVKNGVCASLVIDERFGPFRPAYTFTATQASYTCEVDGQHIVQLPFLSTAPEGVNVYALTDDLIPIAVTIVPAHQPLLVEGEGVVTFLGSGEVSYSPCPLSDDVLPIATPSGIQNIGNIYANESPIYNLQGQRINSMQKGLQIVNGQKFYVK